MEQKRVHDDGLDIARRLYDALCGQYPDKFIILCDAQGRMLARHDGPTVSTTAIDRHAAGLVPSRDYRPRVFRLVSLNGAK